jgi:hypothetical protein
MANSRKAPPKSGKVATFPGPESGVAVEDPPEAANPTTEPSEPSSTLLTKGPGRPKKAEPPRETEFFHQVAAVPQADWGTRVYLYLYQIEPVCDLKKSGGKAYLMRFEEPITDEHRIMVDHGSGKYRFILARNKISPDASNEIARYDFEIYNPQYPPRIPKEAWVPDPRNRRWEALLPKETPPTTATGLSQFTDVLRATTEMRKELREEMQPAQSTQPAQPAAAPADPWVAAEKILNMRSDNPMLDFVKEEMKGLREEMSAGRQREFELQKELRDRLTTTPQTQTASEKPKTLLEQATELAEAAGKLRSIFGTASETGPMGQVVRAAKMGTLEFFAEVLPKIAEAPIMNAWAARLMMPTPIPTDSITGAPEIQPRPTPAPPNADQEFLNFMRYAITPALLEYFEAEQTGAEFALLVNNAYPDRLSQLQNFHHPMIPGMAGPPAIIAAYRNTALWPRLSVRGEEAFTTFVQQFCQWKPEGEESPPQGTAPPSASGEPIDLDEETREAV